MTATAATTPPVVRRPTSVNTLKHAFAHVSAFHRLNSTAGNVTPPAQRHNLDSWRVGLASGTSRHGFYVSVGAGSQTAVLVHDCGNSEGLLKVPDVEHALSRPGTRHELPQC